MDPNSHTTPGLHLPQPTLSQPQPPVQHAPAGQAAHQIANAPSTPTHMPPAPQGVPLAAPAAVPASPTAASSDVSEDQLDEEWVSKAREVVEQYRTDPFTQSRELAVVKAQYLKVRYGKEIKSSKDQP